MRILIRTKPKETAGGNVLQQMLTAYEVFDYIYDFPVFFLLLSKCHDYIRKLNLYADAGAREYWVVDPMVKEVAVYHLEKGSFRAKAYTFQDRIAVNIYDDFQIDFQELDL
nr:Uma2 family endonuclease [uncultured Acetatifactor sp.]